MREGEVQIEEQKINDVTVQETIGEIANDAGEEQGEGETSRQVSRGSLSQEQSTVTTTSATQERMMKKQLLFRKEPKAAPVLVTWTGRRNQG